MEPKAATDDGPGSLAQYVLSDEESRRIFEHEIVPAELAHLDADADAGRRGSGKPTAAAKGVAVLLVGQTGAGKTRTAPLLATAIPPGARRVHLIADTYKSYHPCYADLVARSPALASPATSTDARRWLAMACAFAASRSANYCLVESACRHPADFQDLVRQFRRACYVVRVVVLAVPEALSRLGILVRYYQALPEACSGRLPLRLTPRPVHDATYAGLLDAAAWLDRECPADDVVVLRRGNRVAYRHHRLHHDRHRSGVDTGSGQMATQESHVAQALLRERRRPLAPEELRLAADDLQALRRLYQNLQLETQIGEIEDLFRLMNSSSPASEADRFPLLEPFDHAAFVCHGLAT